MPLEVQFHNITKKFGSILANDNISFGIEKNSVHCILGENGAGKSTLMKILFGVYNPDSGEMEVKGQKVYFKSSHEAINMGIGMLFQHFMLIEDFTVLENTILGYEIEKGFKIDFEESLRILDELIDKYHLGINPLSKVSDLSISEKQKTELLKLLFRESEIIILDEPTSVLSPVEIIDFFNIIKRFKDEGKTVIVITHKLNEVKEISDNVTVLRKGQSVYNTNRKDLSVNILAKEIIGNLNVDTKNDIKVIDTFRGKECIRFENVTFQTNGVSKLNNISFSVYGGEIFGLCGVEGNGQNEIVDLSFGLTKPSNGYIRKFFERVSLVPDDRSQKGMINQLSIGENILLKKSNNFISRNDVRNKTLYIINKYDIRISHTDSLLNSLSGGNQQKVIFAREIEYDAELLLLVHPTRGVDIKASEFLHDKIIEQKMMGKAIFLISSDMEELLKLSDRLAVIYKGNILEEINLKGVLIEDIKVKEDLTNKIGKLMIGTIDN